MSLKVYKMNDCDWVAHYSEEQAIDYYSDLTGIDSDEIVENFEGEVELTETMYWEAKGMPEEDVKKYGLVHEPDSVFGDSYKVPFS